MTIQQLPNLAWKDRLINYPLRGLFQRRTLARRQRRAQAAPAVRRGRSLFHGFQEMRRAKFRSAGVSAAADDMDRPAHRSRFAHPNGYPVWQSSALKHLEDPRQRFRIDVCIHSDASPVAKINLDQPNMRSHHGVHSAVTRKQMLLSFLSFGSCDLHRRKMVQPALMSAPANARQTRGRPLLRCDAQPPSPSRPAPTSLDNPRLVILRPAPPPLQPTQNLDPHRLMTLKLVT
ncbi:hypothetical protein AAFG07_31930 [Bradyrhizobium sp. B097]|uniref:hypothetical protein n=1 Tax=Bradyrhizobium sp. B097 TaxID=3140244 RepID=UPI00318444EB